MVIFTELIRGIFGAGPVTYADTMRLYCTDFIRNTFVEINNKNSDTWCYLVHWIYFGIIVCQTSE